MSVTGLSLVSGVLLALLWKSYRNASAQYNVSSHYINNMSIESTAAPGGSEFYKVLSKSVSDFHDGVEIAKRIKTFTANVWLPSSVVSMFMCFYALVSEGVFGTADGSLNNPGLAFACFAISGVTLAANWFYTKSASYKLYQVWGMEITREALNVKRDELLGLIQEFKDAHTHAEETGTEIDPAWLHAECILRSELRTIQVQLDTTKTMIKRHSDRQ